MKISRLFLVIALGLPLLAFGFLHWYAPLPYYSPGRASYFSFINQDNQPVTNQDIKGKITVVHYFFTSCGTICPKMITGMQHIQQAFFNDDKVALLSLTVDPDRDTPARLKAYATDKGLQLRHWSLATGEERALYRYARNGLFITATDEFFHSDKLVLIDQEGNIRGYYSGTTPAEVNQLISDIQKLHTHES